MKNVNYTGTTFCVDPKGRILITTVHSFDKSWKGESIPTEDIQVVAQRDINPDDRMVFYLWRYFDSALLQVNDIDKETREFKDLDYVSFHDNFSHSR
jgi:hypothetical protein